MCLLQHAIFRSLRLKSECWILRKHVYTSEVEPNKKNQINMSRAPERPKREEPHIEGRPRPRNADNGDNHDHPSGKPAQCHAQTTQDEQLLESDYADLVAPDLLDTRQMQIFYGGCLHETEPVEGERYSLVFFKVNGAESAALPVQQQLTAMGARVHAWTWCQKVAC